MGYAYYQYAVPCLCGVNEANYSNVAQHERGRADNDGYPITLLITAVIVVAVALYRLAKTYGRPSTQALFWNAMFLFQMVTGRFKH